MLFEKWPPLTCAIKFVGVLVSCLLKYFVHLSVEMASSVGIFLPTTLSATISIGIVVVSARTTVVG